MVKVFHRFLVYVTKDVGGRAVYSDSARLCNNGSDTVRLRLRYIGPFTKTGLEGYVRYIALKASNGVSASSEDPESGCFELRPGECISLSVEYVVDDALLRKLDFIRLKMIKDGVISIGGFQFDAIAVDSEHEP
jgi:hypothetical protein